VPRDRLAAVVGRDAAIEVLIGDLRADLAGRPYDVVTTNGGWMLQTRPAYGPAIRAAAHLPAATAGLPELRAFDVAVLAAIAYRQPITRAELADWFGRRIDAETIGRLKAHDVIARGPRNPTPGAPQTLVTTDAFLTMFGLGSLAELLPEQGEAEEA
jgi:chromosome segregation and condensation protein ScpB